MKMNWLQKCLYMGAVFVLVATSTVAKGYAFSTPYLVGETTIAINQQNRPTKLTAQATNGGLISAIKLVNTKETVAYYLVSGNTLYVTGFKPGTMQFQVEETLANARKVLSSPVAVTFYQVNIRTQTACESYDPTTRTLAVSPVNPLTLLVDTNPGTAKPLLHAVLQNPNLGDVQIFYDSTGRSLLQISYKASGSSILTVYDVDNTAIVAISVDFLPMKTVTLNLYHVMDIAGNRSFRLDQEAMIGYMQTAEKILNQSGVTLRINDQQDVYVASNLGKTVDAYSEGQSAEEQAVLSAAPQSTTADVSVFLVWDYQIKNENTIGINYDVDQLGQVIFLSEKSHKPGETLAHEIGHALGLSHNVLGTSYLMSPAEVTTGDQCLITRAERQILNPISI